MARFTNQAQLVYNNVSIPSNVAVGEITEAVSATKTAVVNTYERGDKVTYIVSLVNSGTTDLTGLQVSDNMGGYAYNAGTLYPMAYIPGSARYFVNGVLQAAPVVTPGNPTTFTGLNIPAGGNATLIYEVELNEYAPLDPSGTVTNTATVTGAGLVNPILARETIRPVATPQLSINKAVDPVPVAEGGTLTYTFTISNSGSTPVTAADNVTLSDTFLPVLNNLRATFNGTPWAATTDYTYNTTTGQFTSIAGNITVPAATYTQDPTTGTWSVNPGTSTLVITGTI